MKQTLKYVAAIYGVAVLLFLLDAIGWVRLHENLHRVFMDVGIALLAIGAIHLLDHYSLIREVSARIVERARGLFEQEVTDITKDLEATLRQVKSLESMEQCNLHAIYPSRGAAAQAISESIAASAEVRLMGISLNEFCRDESSTFIKPWRQLVQDIENNKKKAARLLLIDPSCHGAVLRSYSETAAQKELVQDRLDDDVIAVARQLRLLRTTLKDRSNLQVRLYRGTPTMFICGLDADTFVQNYYFWTPRLEGSPTPVLHYLNREKPGDVVNLHKEMEKHFNFIWNHASIPLDNLSEKDGKNSQDSDKGRVRPYRPHFLPELGRTGVESRGAEWGIHASATENVFIDSFRAALRMQEEIQSSNRIWIQGITLKAFFNQSRLAVTLTTRIRNQTQGDDIRVLLLDPDCDQAKVRAYREYLLNHTAISFDEFTLNHYLNESPLWRDLRETKARIEEIEQKYKRDIMALYRTPPHMFVLIGDNAAFVEQYTFGKLTAHLPDLDVDVLLGSDMPLIEYRRTIDPVYVRALELLRTREPELTEQLRPLPYPLLESHFDFAWKQAGTAKTAAPVPV